MKIKIRGKEMVIPNHHIFWNGLGIMGMIAFLILSPVWFMTFQVVLFIIIILNIVDNTGSDWLKHIILYSLIAMGIFLVVTGVVMLSDYIVKKTKNLKWENPITKFNKWLDNV